MQHAKITRPGVNKSRCLEINTIAKKKVGRGPDLVGCLYSKTDCIADIENGVGWKRVFHSLRVLRNERKARSDKIE